MTSPWCGWSGRRPDESDPGPQAVRRLFSDLMRFDDVARFLGERIASTGIRYDVGDPGAAVDSGSDDRSLLGRRLHDLPLADGGRLFTLLHEGRGFLLDQTGTHNVTGWADRVDRVATTTPELAATAVLLRPDGHVVWLADGREPLEPALRRWFGEPTR